MLIEAQLCMLICSSVTSQVSRQSRCLNNARNMLMKGSLFLHLAPHLPSRPPLHLFSRAALCRTATTIHEELTLQSRKASSNNRRSHAKRNATILEDAPDISIMSSLPCIGTPRRCDMVRMRWVVLTVMSCTGLLEINSISHKICVESIARQAQADAREHICVQ